MGEPPVNFFGGSPLNRLSWLRESSKFLNAAANDASARWVVFRDGDPLMMRKGGELAYLTTEQVGGVLGPDGRVFGQGREVDEDGGENVKALMGARLRGPVVVFLGVLEREDVKALPTAEFGSAEDLTGIPYLVVDVSKVPKEVVEETLKDEETGAKALELAFVESRAASRTFRALDASVFSLGRSMIDWNLRNRVSS
ncbi:NADH pyrophosphatase [Tulasnella sp. 403]|nr:NADH pyrophosphatase [Tulasnella sp. 403]